MNSKPSYFEVIRKNAARRWDQLDADPELAGPWHQLFKQVQSPQHVFSELLQNADDAGATEASACIEGHVFVFEHNGEDFTEEHFASLCRFGYSNKRNLHTIGFRGIGFKSTFSLGDRVELVTPSLRVAFHRQRFTEPEWLDSSSGTDGRTRIQVELSDSHCERDLETNLENWLESPVSLLFFRNIRRMRIGQREAQWSSLGPGPIPESEWMSLAGKKEKALLLIRSNAEAFPDDALAEIWRERTLGTTERIEFPPCRIEIVLGAKGQLFVILPTGVETDLPFACNAPFIQDPARLKIKDPQISPTNRWLLGRAGRLAASAMLGWLDQNDTSLTERGRAYRLLPDVSGDDSSLGGMCGSTVKDAFAGVLDGKNVLLAEDGQLLPKKQCVILQRQILDIWSPEQAAALFDEDDRPPLSRNVDASDRKKLLRWGIVDEIDKQTLLEILQEKRPPKPATWRQLLSLWAYVAPDITGWFYVANPMEVMIVPVQGKDVLYAAKEVVRLGEKKLLESNNDWKFLAQYLTVLDPNWPRFLAAQRRGAVDQAAASSGKDYVIAAYDLLKGIGLDEASDVSKFIAQVAKAFFAQPGVAVVGCVQLAQIAAKLGASIDDGFKYVTRDSLPRPSGDSILFDDDGSLECLLSDAKRKSQLLHQGYSNAFTSCSKDDWKKWIASGRSNLLTFVPLVQKRVSVYRRKIIEQEGRKRGYQGTFSYPYVTDQFVVEDWDFDEEYWRHWKGLAVDDERIWVTILERILAQGGTYWGDAKGARLLQVATTGNTRSITHSMLLPSWALRLRALPCLSDTRGFQYRPGDLLRRTPETESLLDIEPFVNGRIDREATRPLLDILGVRSIPTGPDRLLECLRALSKAETPPVHEVEKWYRRLDQMLGNCSTTDFQNISQALRSERLILTQDGAWMSASSVFLSANDEDVPDAAVIMSSVSDLTLWRKIGLAERPTADLAIEWLKSLGSGTALSRADARRVRSLLQRFPIRIWEECGHWVNLAGDWVPVDSLSFLLTPQPHVPWLHLHEWVKMRTADLQQLPGETTCYRPFVDLPHLASQIQERFQHDPSFMVRQPNKEWLNAFATELCRIELEREEETDRVRALASRLSKTNWIEMQGLEIIPYIGGTPAGTPRRTDVAWLDTCLYVEPMSIAKLARRVPEEIGKPFARPDIKAALDYSFERSAQDVRQYLAENFTLTTAIVSPPRRVDGSDIQNTTGFSTSVPPLQISNDVDETALATGMDVILAAPEPSNEAEERAEESKSAQIASDSGSSHRPLSREGPKTVKPSIIERFAVAEGFRKNGEQRFLHANGTWLGRTNGAPFPWERHAANGDLLCYYWPKDHCLEREPLQLDSDVWGLLEAHPDMYALILSNVEGRPVEITGASVRAMRDRGEITLYPASYRLVLSGDPDA